MQCVVRSEMKKGEFNASIVCGIATFVCTDICCEAKSHSNEKKNKAEGKFFNVAEVQKSFHNGKQIISN